jgi:hypothetical protein
MKPMTNTRTIAIAKQFSDVPAGRFYSDGEVSGQAFRERLLLPALANGGHVLVDLDGVEGYGSSFLEEAFGGLIREHGLRFADLQDRLSFKSNEEPSYIEEILGYLKDEADGK